MRMPALLVVTWVTIALRGLAADPSREALATVVLYNRNDEESRALAKYYAEKRGIPFSQVLGLNCASEEEISRDAYLVTIEAPLRSAFTKNEWWKIERNSDSRRQVVAANKRFVAIMRGVPLKIRHDDKAPITSFPKGSTLEKLANHNEASVDSELASMFALEESTSAVLANPYFRSFRRIFDVPAGQGPLLVCRLDGPSDVIVRKMIDDAIATEKSGLWGWAYLDARSIKSGGYKEGDDWILEAGVLMRKQGIPVILDLSPKIFADGFPITDAAIYYGWYTSEVAGPFARPNFRFVPGAVAVHLHSFSARTIRSSTTAWVGPLLARGATATMGNVYEPFLSLTVDFSALQDRLMNGFTLAEAGYASYRGLSWMGIIVGDPLYRPYANWNELDAVRIDNSWSRYRSAVLAAGGDPVAAAPALEKLAAESGDSMFLEALAQAKAVAKNFTGAIASIEAALKIEKSTAIRFRLTLEKIDFLRRGSRASEARSAVAEALDRFHAPDQIAVLDQLALELQPKPKN